MNTAARTGAGREDEDDDGDVDEDDDDEKVKNEAHKRMVWMSGVTSLDESIFGAIPVDNLPEGLYTLLLKVSPAGRQNAYYLWATAFVINK